MEKFLEETPLLNYSDPTIQNIINENGWFQFNEKERIIAVYNFVRNHIVFGYNESDDMTAAQVLHDGYGQCNTKSILLMALLRALGIPCRIQGFYIDKRMQKGALTGLAYIFAPKKIVHAWTEVYFNDTWIVLEGVIIDEAYLEHVQDKLCSFNNGYMGYGISVENKENINLCWTGESTFIQSFSITEQLGIFTNPDDFFERFNNTKSALKRIIFNFLRKRINRRLNRIRKGQ